MFVESLEWRIAHEELHARGTLIAARDAVARALAQLTQDDKLTCDRCSTVKPTKRALAAHVALVHG